MFDGAFEPMHLLIVLVIVFLLFGAKRLPELGRSLGTGIREFKTGISEIHAGSEDEPPAARSAESILTAMAPPAATADAAPAESAPTRVADE
jgi:sec-independent protein translocase protein TatA